MRPGGGGVDPQRRAGGFVAGRAVILLAAAVLIGAATLHAIDRGVDVNALRAQSGSAETTTPTKAKKPSRQAAQPTSTTTTTLPTRPPAEIKVLPVNGTNVAGVAGRTGDVLRRAGYNVLAPTNTTKPVDSSSVQFLPGHESEAKEVAKLLALPDTAVQPLSSPPPLADTRGADVIVIVGPDLAARTAPVTTTTIRRVTTTTGVRAIPATTTTRPAATTTTAPQ